MEILLGISTVLLGGVLNGSFVAPLKKLPRWAWENSWLVYSVVGLLVIPWAVAWLTVPRLGEVLTGASPEVVQRVLGFGFGWGIGSVLFGLGIDRLGLAIGYGLILGLIAPIGTFYPLLILHPDELWTQRGLALTIGTVIVLSGIVLCAKAARLREGPATPRGSFLTGLVICILAGIFSPMLNFSFAFGGELQERALAAGANLDAASNAIWPLCLTAGLLPNAGYAVYRLYRNRTWARFRGSRLRDWSWASSMGLLCFGSFVVYGAGANTLGELGPVVGWPLFMSMALITSNTLGWLSGEWREAPPQAVRYSRLGVLLLILAIAVIAVGNRVSS